MTLPSNNLPLGKAPAPGYSPKLASFDTYANAKKSNPIVSPKIPFGHGNSFAHWGMLGNDTYGDCVYAGRNHEWMLLRNLATGGKTNQNAVTFNTNVTLSDYFDGNGVPPGPPGSSSDQGSDVQTSLKYSQHTGNLDATGVRHKAGAYVSLKIGDFHEVIDALWIFEIVGIGFEFPDTAMDQFNNGQPWAVESGSNIVGGHYVPVVGVPSNNEFAVVTWGKRQLMTFDFYSQYCDEAYAWITKEELNARKNTNWGGFNWTALMNDLQII